MNPLALGIYDLLLRLHPTDFRRKFAREMAMDFKDALHTYGVGRLLLDIAVSLARQWSASVCSTALAPIVGYRVLRHDVNDAGIHDTPFSPQALGLGFIASMTQIALCLFALNANVDHRSDFSNAYARDSAPATRRNVEPGVTAQVDGTSSFDLAPSRSTLADFTSVSSASAPLPPVVSGTTPGCTVSNVPQNVQPKPVMLLFHPPGPLLSYEVATVKLLDPNAARDMVKLAPGVTLSPLSMRRYIMDAYGAVYQPQVIGGPNWLNKDAYLIRGKVPDDMQSALENMTREERNDQTRMMKQCLLADRFHLKAHLEARILPVFALVPANGGLKITQVPAPPEHKSGDAPLPPSSDGQLSPGSVLTARNNDGARVLNARAIKMQLLVRILGSDMGDRPLVDRTGFTGSFDVTDLTWAPFVESGASTEFHAASITGALQEKLGIRVIPDKDRIEVLVIDEIDRPTPN